MQYPAKIYKSIFLWLSMLSASVAMTGCSASAPGEEPDEEGVSVEMRLRLASDIETRAGGRPLESSDEWQRVDNVMVYPFKLADNGNQYIYYGNPVEITDFHKNEIWKDDEDERHSCVITDLYPEGRYRFFAVGIDSPASAGITLDLQAGITEWNEVVIKCESVSTPVVNEFFTGYACNEDGTPVDFYLFKGSKYNVVEIELKRCVAGVLLYVKNIPVKVKSEFTWPNEESGKKGNMVDAGSEYYVKEVAIVAKSFNPMCSPYIRKWEGGKSLPASRFGLVDIVSISTEGLTAEDDLYKTPQCSGEFVLPSELSSGIIAVDEKKEETEEGSGDDEVEDTPEDENPSPSLQLCYYTIIGSEKVPVKMSPIKLDTSSSASANPDLNLSADRMRFNLVANQLYCLGLRNITNGIDEPVDLQNALSLPELSIVAIGSWQADVNIKF